MAVSAFRTEHAQNADTTRAKQIKLLELMKKKDDPRHLVRIKIFQALFERGFRKEKKLKENSLDFEVFQNVTEIDRIIEKHAPEWPLDQISPVDLATLRLAVWELLFKKQEPYKVVVDEAVEIAKEYGTESSPVFVNGVLGTVIKTNLKNKIQKIKTSTLT